MKITHQFPSLIFRRCSKNQPLYKALQGDRLIDLASILAPLDDIDVMGMVCPCNDFYPQSLSFSCKESIIDYVALSSQATNAILANSTRMDLQSLPTFIRNASHLHTYSNTLDQFMVHSNLNSIASSLTDLATLFDSLVSKIQSLLTNCERLF